MPNVLITGGAKGLGAHLAQHLAAQGHRILVLDRTAREDVDPNHLATLDDYMTADLADWPEVRDCVARVLQEHDQRVDVLINNAAVRSFDDFAAFDASEIERCIRVNFETPVLLIRELLPAMQRNGYGRVVNIGSRTGFHAYPSGSLYCSTKNALTVFTESVGQELAEGGKGVTINAICPDSFRTREGVELPRFERTLATMASQLDSLLASERNGEVILVASRRRVLEGAVASFRKRARWLVQR